MKKRVFEIVEEAAPGNRASQTFDIFIISLIALNAVALIVGTVEEIHQVSPQAFRTFEIISVAIFTVEYLLRVWACTADPRYAHPVFGRLRFIISPIALIDLLAILPFYMVLFVNLHGLDLRFLRAVRLLARVARVDDLITDFLCRKGSPTRQVCQHSPSHVVECHHPYHRRLRRRVSGHCSRAPARRTDSDSGNRIVCPTRRYPGIRLCG